jgi:ATP-dependent Zn protease
LIVLITPAVFKFSAFMPAAKPLSKDVDLDKVARRTPGYTGADLGQPLE